MSSGPRDTSSASSTNGSLRGSAFGIPHSHSHVDGAGDGSGVGNPSQTQTHLPVQAGHAGPWTPGVALLWFSSLDTDAEASHTRPSASAVAADRDPDAARAARVAKTEAAMERGAMGKPSSPAERDKRTAMAAMRARWRDSTPVGQRVWAPRHSVDSIAGRAASRSMKVTLLPPLSPGFEEAGDAIAIVEAMLPKFEDSVQDRGGRGPQVVQPRPAAS